MQNSFVNSFFYLILLFGWQGLAKEPVYFLPEKNNLQILPQKFEYNLLNNSTIKIGDIVIDSNNLALLLNAENGLSTFTFTWPAGLFPEAELVVFNNYGKAIQNYSISKKDVELILDTKDQGDALLRMDKAIYKTNPLEPGLLDELKYLPFFKFCLQRKEENTRIDLCSVELYFSSKDGKPSIKMRSESKKQAQILVNNAEVGEQGIIFLNDRKESINFLAQSESGAKLEIETRLKPVDFKDVVISDDGKNLLLTGAGSFPVSDKNLKKLSGNLWQVSVPVEFPVFYIQGEGGIPFRQEFFVRGSLPTEKLRAYSNDLISTTYRSSQRMTLETPKGIALYSKDANSKTGANKSNQKVEWNVTGLEKGQYSKRILFMKKDKNEFAIYHSIFRAPGFEGQFSTSYLTAEKLNFINLGLNYWFDNKKSSIGLGFDQALNKTTTIEKWSIAELTYLHRLKSGLNFKDSSYYISTHLRSMSIGSLSFSQIGLGLGQKQDLEGRFLNSLADWLDWSFRYYLGSKSNNSEIKSLLKTEVKFYVRLSTLFLIDYGLAFQNISTSNIDGLKSTQLDIRTGLTYLF